MREMIVDIGPDGEVRIETRGFSGKSCISESQFLKELLGRQTAKELTPAYWQAESEEGVVIKRHLPLCG